MKQPTFFEGVAFALAVSVVGSVLFTVLAAILPIDSVSKLLIAVASLGYIAYLLLRSRERLGRITLVALWLLLTAAAWIFSPSLALYGALQLGMIWTARSLYHHGSLLSASADMALNALAVAAAMWTAYQTGSLFLTTWCFFLVQALFVYIPSRPFREQKHTDRSGVDEQRFQQAQRAAYAALQRLAHDNSKPGGAK
jgi:hypothetical protein